MKKNNFIFNENLCVACEACLIACSIENGTNVSFGWRNISTSNHQKLPGIPIFNLSLACNHCEHPPCLINCPANAYEVDKVTGAVILQEMKCIGCEYCTWQCPYDSPVLNKNTGIIEKCTFCSSRIIEGKVPSCANLCPTGALGFLSNGVPDKPLQESIPEFPGPSIIIYENIEERRTRIDESLFQTNITEPTKHKSGKGFTSINEWPLIIFTFITTLSVSLVTAFNINSLGIDTKFMLGGLLVFAAIVSIMHLGKKKLFLRSVLNIKNSWLSMEILFFSMFFSLFFVSMFFFRIPRSLIVLTGITTLLSIDMLYKPLQENWRYQVHSGQTLPIVISLFMIFSGYFIAFGFLLGVRLFYTLLFDKENIVLVILRYLFPLKGLLLISTAFAPELGIGLLVAGEFLDRLLFYSVLRKPVMAKYI